MLRRVDSRDVLDPNGRTRCALVGRVVGRFRRIGPNTWDDYELRPGGGETLRVARGIKIQVEEHGARFRIRRRGQVLLVEWVPSEEQQTAMASARRDPRQAFLESCVRDYSSPPGVGLAAVIAKKIADRD